jgi:hypothetical protein
LIEVYVEEVCDCNDCLRYRVANSKKNYENNAALQGKAKTESLSLRCSLHISAIQTLNTPKAGASLTIGFEDILFFLDVFGLFAFVATTALPSFVVSCFVIVHLLFFH